MPLSSDYAELRTGGVGRQALRIASEPEPELLLMMVLLCREEEQEEGALEVRVEADEECSEYLGSGRLLWAMAKGCLLFRDIIIIFAGRPSRGECLLISEDSASSSARR